MSRFRVRGISGVPRFSFTAVGPLIICGGLLSSRDFDRKSVRYLGVYFDEMLKVLGHVRFLEGKVIALFDRLRGCASAGWGLHY